MDHELADWELPEAELSDDDKEVQAVFEAQKTDALHEALTLRLADAEALAKGIKAQLAEIAPKETPKQKDEPKVEAKKAPAKAAPKAEESVDKEDAPKA